MQRVAAPSANFCAGSSTKAPPLTAPCQIGRTQARRAGGFAAVGGGLRPPPNPPSGRVALRAARFLQGAFPRPLPPPGPCKAPSARRPPLPRHPPAGCRHRAAGRPARRAGPPGARRRGGGCAAGPAARPFPFPTSPLPPGLRPVCPFRNSSPAPKPKPPTLPLGKPGACTFLHINSLTAPRFGLRPAVPDSPACSGGRRRPRRRNTPPAPPWPPGRHGRPRTPSQ